MNITDQPNDVRKEDTLDNHKLSIYLKEHLSFFNDHDTLVIKQYSGGASNLTYLLKWSNNNV